MIFVITQDIVKKKVTGIDINKSSGPDDLSGRVRKEMREVLALSIFILFKNSLESGCIPSIWKTTSVRAIYEKGENIRWNYRPVTLTCIICKLLEKIVGENMEEYEKKHHLFSDKQFGFISGRSCNS